MPKFQVAHIREQGQQIIIVVVADDFHHRASIEQNEAWRAIQRCASGAGLAGTVALVWDAGGGRMGFLAPDAWQPFFRSLNLAVVARNINRQLTCG